MAWAGLLFLSHSQPANTATPHPIVQCVTIALQLGSFSAPLLALARESDVKQPHTPIFDLWWWTGACGWALALDHSDHVASGIVRGCVGSPITQY
ncbi:hypothetical protein B0T24DRAFT_618713 [Lasiosphaeria ovina]|uniref:Secreted protein n=1 Tax=Lasiosphaeria ovina TaxID=92902 RepID=A0AAE0KGR3_9PEZI|nr:hypothetical protein B0T24DRAFT_618713 [Lasiosphaeria ovina]